MQKADLALRRWIVPTQDTNDADDVETPSPAYARRPDFRLDLNPIMRNGALSASVLREEGVPML